MTQLLNPGATLLISRAASVQFTQPIVFRLIRVLPYPTYDGWAWLDGYEIDPTSRDAIARREIFVQRAGVRVVAQETAQERAKKAQLNGGPASVHRRVPVSQSTLTHRMSS